MGEGGLLQRFPTTCMKMELIARQDTLECTMNRSNPNKQHPLRLGWSTCCTFKVPMKCCLLRFCVTCHRLPISINRYMFQHSRIIPSTTISPSPLLSSSPPPPHTHTSHSTHHFLLLSPLYSLVNLVYCFVKPDVHTEQEKQSQQRPPTNPPVVTHQGDVASN